MKYFQEIKQLIPRLERQQEEIRKAGRIIADTVMRGGIIHSFGSGHSHAIALETSRRAGGLVPILALEEPTQGQYERIEGVGYEFWRRLDVRDLDSFIIISNSGRNPLPVELAEKVKERGLPLIVVTSLEFSRSQSSRLASGKKLYEYADLVLDNCVPPGDSSISLEGVTARTGPVSTIAGCLLLNQAVVNATEMLRDAGMIPPVLQSANIDGGREYNEELLTRYYERLRENIVI